MLALLQILLVHTDQDHILTRKQLFALLKQEKQVTMDKKTFYRYIDQLNRNRYIKIVYDQKCQGYYLEKFYFTRGEILLLCNAIHNFNFVGKSDSDSLIHRFKQLMPSSYFNVFQQSIYMPNNKKTENTELMTNIEVITRAIAQNQKISFDYLHYGKDKELHPVNHRGPIIVEARFIIYQNNNAYLLATGSKYKDSKFAPFRIEKITNLTITKEDCSPFDYEMDAAKYASRKYYMLAEPNTKVTFLCKTEKLDYMLETFGREPMLIWNSDETEFRFTTSISRSSAILFAMEWFDYVEIVYPEDLRQEFAQKIRKGLRRYAAGGRE